MAVATHSTAFVRFLYSAADWKNQLKDHSRICLVTGNEGADLDSIVGALTLAFFLSTTEAKKDTIYLPVINIQEDDFVFRTDAGCLWKKKETNLGGVPLVFFPKISKEIDELHKQKRLEVVLTDHHIPAANMKAFEDSITQIVDHRPFEEKNITKTAKFEIELVGSATTLIAHRYLEQNRKALESNHDVAFMLLSTLALDTINLDVKAKRTTDKDTKVAKELETILGLTDADRTKLFEELQAAKFDQSTLSLADVLRSDYKEWKTAGVTYGIASSKLTLVRPFFEANKKTLEEFVEKRSLHFLLVMNARFDHGKFQRDLVIVCKVDHGAQKLVEFMVDEKRNFQLEALSPVTYSSDPKEFVVAYYHQKNVDFARKQLQPFVDEFLNTHKQ